MVLRFLLHVCYFYRQIIRIAGFQIVKVLRAEKRVSLTLNCLERLKHQTSTRVLVAQLVHGWTDPPLPCIQYE